MARSKTLSLDGLHSLLCLKRDHDGYNNHWRTVRWSFSHRPCKWLVYDFRATLHPSASPLCFQICIPLTHRKESAPARYRGLMIAVFQFWTSIGVLIGTLVDNATHKIDGKNSYMIPLGIIYVVPVFMSVGLFFIPESPRWLLYKDKNEEGLKSLMWMRPHPEAVPEEMADIQAAILAEKELASSASLVDIIKNPIDRRRTLLAVAAISTQAASGAMFMIGECFHSFYY
jgi:MFS family permease